MSRSVEMNRARSPKTAKTRAVESSARAVSTPLSRSLADKQPKRRSTPMDVFTLATNKWLEGERLDIGRISKELGVGRATVFRWVGSREQLYGEVLSAGYAQLMTRARERIRGSGVEHFIAVTHRILLRLVKSEPLRRFVEQDPEFAIRVLTAPGSPVQRRCIDILRQWLAELEQAGEIRPALDAETLAFIIVRICEAFLYGDVLGDREPEIEKAIAAIRILITADREDARFKKPAAAEATSTQKLPRTRAV